ncbi:hypothetical protein COCMIDRAFT_25747 [Bipolaris oryzae ATCC 44560]|uniref:Uncharacterized protein n=1 Tax=Bipolaris oryzae ATCC 44560 TaxID=930090 RepID=W6Z397_COCMI|nr:uncharacterized protein COCMIDRAFT_25747 [Bipolaris oryzae ATCC 44560]EUC46202.1 hypothetical protein COCMIDRAFT_25747 [Bipolaris oryzae ATCC 44560]
MDVSQEETFLNCEETRKECEFFIKFCKTENMGPGLMPRFWQSALMLSRSLTDRFLGAEMQSSKPAWWTDELVQRHLKTIHRVRNCERELRYLAHDKEIFPLPREDVCATESRELLEAVLVGVNHDMVAARVLYLLKESSEGRSTFPSDGGLRYGGRDFWANLTGGDEVLLPEQYRFLRWDHRMEPLSQEWQAAVGLVGWLTQQERNLARTIRGSCVEASVIDTDDRVELSQTSIAYEMIGPNCKDCPVCQEGLAKAAAEDGEVPIKTPCGHVVGKDCLQAWVKPWDGDEKPGNPTCPMCRAQLPLLGSLPLIKQLELLPREVQQIAREWVAYARSDEALDREVDTFLLEAREEEIYGCYGVELGDMLARLETRRLTFIQYQKALEEVLAGMRTG